MLALVHNGHVCSTERITECVFCNQAIPHDYPSCTGLVQFRVTHPVAGIVRVGTAKTHEGAMVRACMQADQQPPW